MEVRRKKRLKIIIPLCVCAIVLIGLVLYLFLPPTRGRYRLELQLDYRSGEERGTALSGSERKTLETKTGEEVHFSGELINGTARWQKAAFAETELLKITIYRGEEKVYEKGSDRGTSYTFPWTVGCRCYSEYRLYFSYAFEEAGTYTVTASSKFKQIGKSYSYQTEPLTVIVK